MVHTYCAKGRMVGKVRGRANAAWVKVTLKEPHQYVRGPIPRMVCPSGPAVDVQYGITIGAKHTQVGDTNANQRKGAP